MVRVFRRFFKILTHSSKEELNEYRECFDNKFGIGCFEKLIQNIKNTKVPLHYSKRINKAAVGTSVKENIGDASFESHITDLFHNELALLFFRDEKYNYIYQKMCHSLEEYFENHKN